MKNSGKIFPFIILLELIISSCAPARIVKPLDKGQKVVGINAGGPLIEFADLTIPMPLSSVYGGYGVTENSTVYGGIHTTSLLFGVYQTDLGLNQRLLEQNKYIPGITLNPAVNLMTGKWEGAFKFYPELGVNACWNYASKDHYFYAGSMIWPELEPKDLSSPFILSFQAGHTFSTPRWFYTVEARLLGPFKSHKDIVVDYKGLGNNGAFGVYFSVSRKF